MIEKISYNAKEDEINFKVSYDCPREITLVIKSPATCTSDCYDIQTIKIDSDNHFTLKRYSSGHDGLFLRYEISGYETKGIHYLNEITNTLYSYRKPVLQTKKGLRMQDIDEGISLGAKYDTIDVSVQDILRTYPEDNSVEYEYNYRTWYINQPYVDELDKKLKKYYDNGVLVTLTLLICTPVDSRLHKTIVHPQYRSIGRMSAFNILTSEGALYFECLFHYLAERYTREDAKYGRIYGLIIGNEVTSQSVWYNAGTPTCAQFCKEYLSVLRLAWTAGAIYCEDWCVYASLDDHWGEKLTNFLNYDDNSFYKGHDVLINLLRQSYREGDFYWCIAYHPYSQNLLQADFWNDPGSTDDPETSPVISFKNLYLLQQFVSNQSTWYNGKKLRKILLSEQGFHSYNNYLGELIQAFAYGAAYKISMELDAVEAFIYHSQTDSPAEEFSLKLGLNTYNHKGKMIKEIFKTIDQIDPETGKFCWERF